MRNYLLSIFPPILFLFIFLLTNSCTHTTTQKLSPSLSIPIIPIYVENTFQPSEWIIIRSAIEEWNLALNNEMRLELISLSYERNSILGEKIKEAISMSNNGLIIYRASSDTDPINQIFSDDGHLAFVDQIGGHLMLIMPERMKGYDWKSIILHELGHSLGCQHTNMASLMFPISALGLQIRCIDKTSIMQAGTYHHLDLDKLKYCPIKGFE